MAWMEAIERSKMNKFNEAINVINELLKYGSHRGKCDFTLGKGCAKHLKAHKRRERLAIKFMVANGYIPGSKP